jgi:hypothetical protein
VRVIVFQVMTSETHLIPSAAKRSDTG